MPVDEVRFNQIIADKGLSNSLKMGIGTISEKCVHMVLKDYYDPLKAHQERKIGPFYADIFDGTSIIEVQTKSFDKLRKKLDVFLNDYDVTIVYPIFKEKMIIHFDPFTGELDKKKKAPRKGSIYDSILELYKIKLYLHHPRLSLRLTSINVLEYRSLVQSENLKRKKSVKVDKIPTKIVDELNLREPLDYEVFLPKDLNPEFSSADFAKSAKINKHIAQITLNILNYLGVVTRIKKQGNSFLYKRTSEIVETNDLNLAYFE